MDFARFGSKPLDIEIPSPITFTHQHYLLIAATAMLFPLLTFAQLYVSATIGIFSSSTNIRTKRDGTTLYFPSRGEYQVTGGGADIWGTADDFHFSWVQLLRRLET